MKPGALTAFERMLAEGKDSVMLRFSLGNGYLGQDMPEKAVRHLAVAVEMDPDYSAAWKLYGKALGLVGDHGGAAQAYRTGIEVAERKGDVQAAKEMRVFLRREEKAMARC